MRMRICLANGKTCKESDTAGSWLTLPMSWDKLEQALQGIADNDAGCLIVDFEAPFIIEQDDNVFAINETAAVLSQYDDRLVLALCGCTENVDQVISILTGGYYIVHYGVGSLHDVADILLHSGYYGYVPAAVQRYIDYDKIVAELESAGWHMQYEVRVAVLPLS